MCVQRKGGVTHAQRMGRRKKRRERENFKYVSVLRNKIVTVYLFRSSSHKQQPYIPTPAPASPVSKTQKISVKTRKVKDKGKKRNKSTNNAKSLKAAFSSAPSCSSSSWLSFWRITNSFFSFGCFCLRVCLFASHFVSHSPSQAASSTPCFFPLSPPR